MEATPRTSPPTTPATSSLRTATARIAVVVEALNACIPGRVRRDLNLDLAFAAKVLADAILLPSGRYRPMRTDDVRAAFVAGHVPVLGAGRIAAWHRDAVGDTLPVDR